MAEYVLEISPAARARHIHEMVGIRPDERYHVPLAETEALVRGVKTHDEQAGVKLIATRLNWVYTQFAAMEPVRQRQDYELEDIMQLGVLATLHVAERADFNLSTHVAQQLHAETPRYMGHVMMQGKLTPTIDNISMRPTYYVGTKRERRTFAEGLPEAVELVEYERLAQLIDEGAVDIPVSIENEITDPELIYAAVADILLSKLSHQDRQVLELDWGLGDEARLSHVKIAERLGISGLRVRTAAFKGLLTMKNLVTGSELSSLLQERQLEMADILDLLHKGDHTNYGLRS